MGRLQALCALVLNSVTGSWGDASCMLQHRAGPEGIPCTIHQLDAGETTMSKSWTSMNPECDHKLWNETQVETLVREQSPDLIWPIWDVLSTEERADVFRYLVIWDQGGYWADSDVTCVKPIADYPVPPNATMIVGYEFGHRWSEKQRQEVNFARPEQFARYFFAAAPRSPVLLRCLRMVRQRYAWKVLATDEFSGAVFSDAIHEFLESDESMEKEISLRRSRSKGQHLLLSFPSERMYIHNGWNVWILAAGRVNTAPQVSADDPMEAQTPLVLRHVKPQPKLA